MTAETLVERLGRLDSCVVSDALDRLGLTGVVVGLRPMWACPRIVGRVVTVKLVPVGDSGPAHGGGPARHLGTAAIEAAAPGDVIAIDHGGRDISGGWGGILSLAAQLKGIAGVIVDGACRDIDEGRDLGFPIYARSAIPLTARQRVVEQSFNEPVRLGDVTVHPGDLVLADWSGVVFVLAARAEEIVQAAEGLAAREAAMAEALRAGRSVVEVMGANYESMISR
ncbi:MAG: RraA family protein [Dehalococcoidia bacterium]